MQAGHRPQFRRQTSLALPQGFLCPLALGNLLGEDENAADLATARVPRADLPPQPLYRPLGTLEGVFVGPHDVTGQAPAVGLPPAVGDVGEDLVVGLADDVTGEAVVG